VVGSFNAHSLKAEPIEPSTQSPPHPLLLTTPHRLFFLMTAVFGTLSMALWLVGLQGALSYDASWHGHEMIFGFVGVTFAGFLLTAVPRWTNQPGLKGAWLAGLCGLWVLGRLTMAFDGPVWLDLLFVPALLIVVLRDIVVGRNWRNLTIPVVLAMLTALNVLYHMDGDLIAPGDALRAAAYTVTAMIALIGGRVMAPFTGNALGVKIQESRFAQTMEAVSIIAVLSTAVLAAVAPDTKWLGAAALFAGVVLGFRMIGWRSLATWRLPIVWVLHVGYAWLPVGYVLTGMALIWGWVDPSAALHALTAGAIGMMILAMATRASLGHGGRDIKADGPTIVAYVCIIVAALLRVLAPPDWVEAAVVAWIVGYGLFVFAFWSVLTRPRVDGKPG
jgi:uncharacterized protein involved in response to NO